MKGCSLMRSLGLVCCTTIGTVGCGAEVDGGNGTASSTSGGHSATSAIATGGGSSGSRGNAETGGASESRTAGGTTAFSGTGGTRSVAAGSGGVPADSGGAGGATHSSNHGAGGVSGAGGSSVGASGAGTGGVTSATGGANDGGGLTTTASGGRSSAGGSNTAAGTSATGGNSTKTSDCVITVKDASYISAFRAGVGIVTWSTNLANVDKAQIDFGVDATYGLTAPVDLEETDYRTVLLGMKEGHAPYHFRITAWAGSTECVGDDVVFASKTPVRPSSLKAPRVTTNDPSATYGGFLVTVGFRMGVAGDVAFILDQDGECVWAYMPSGFGSLSVARMTHDAKAMWIGSANIPQATARVGRVSMDGQTFEDMSDEFQGFHHDLEVLPDESVVFIAYGEGNCDEIRRLTPDGKVTTIVNACKAFGNASVSHCNALRHDPYDGTVVFAEDNHSAYVKVDLEGNIKWVLNGGSSFGSFDNSGGGSSWVGSHGLHMIGKDRILLFNNGISQDFPDAGGVAVVRELTLDTTHWTTNEVWNYGPGIESALFGDVQRLENGNTLVVFSLGGAVHEIDGNGNLVQSLEWAGLSGAGLGYASKRKTLYGPPPQ